LHKLGLLLIFYAVHGHSYMPSSVYTVYICPCILLKRMHHSSSADRKVKHWYCRTGHWRTAWWL